MSQSKSAGPFVSTGCALPRRQFLRAAGVALALPWLDAMRPAFAAETAEESPRRLLAICNNLGVLEGGFFPKTGGKDYELSAYLSLLKPYRDDFTVFSGVSHPNVDGAHSSDVCFLTAAPHPSNGGFRNSISLDQFVADRIGERTRFPSLTLGVNVSRGARSLSCTNAGVMLPCDDKASQVYRRLFLQGSEQEMDKQLSRLQLGESIMDSVADNARDLERSLGPADRERLDQYITGVREMERRMVVARAWERKPKPKPSEPEPVDPASSAAYMARTRLMYDMAHLALQTDSTRVVTIFLDSFSSPAIQVEGIEITDGYHNLSHHGQNESKLAQLRAIDNAHMKLIGELFGKMKAAAENQGTLLDRTMILYGSNLGDANTHATTNLPVLLAGGGFRHGQHLVFDREKNYPLPNLYLTMIQRMGIEADRFASSTGTFTGLGIRA